MDEEEEQVDALNQQEGADLDTADEEQEETIDDVRARLTQAEEARLKAEEIAENQRIRAEKAERKAKEQPEAKPEAKPSREKDGLSSMDTIALIGAKVTEKEDIDEVLDYAKLKGLSISEALKAGVVKTILAEKAEQRQTAAATNTGAARRGTTKISDEQILANASQGKYPEDPEALAEARMQAKKSKKN